MLSPLQQNVHAGLSAAQRAAAVAQQIHGRGEYWGDPSNPDRLAAEAHRHAAMGITAYDRIFRDLDYHHVKGRRAILEEEHLQWLWISFNIAEALGRAHIVSTRKHFRAKFDYLSNNMYLFETVVGEEEARDRLCSDISGEEVLARARIYALARTAHAKVVGLDAARQQGRALQRVAVQERESLERAAIVNDALVGLWAARETFERRSLRITDLAAQRAAAAKPAAVQQQAQDEEVGAVEEPMTRAAPSSPPPPPPVAVPERTYPQETNANAYDEAARIREDAMAHAHWTMLNALVGAGYVHEDAGRHALRTQEAAAWDNLQSAFRDGVARIHARAAAAAAFESQQRAVRETQALAVLPPPPVASTPSPPRSSEAPPPDRGVTLNVYTAQGGCCGHTVQHGHDGSGCCVNSQTICSVHGHCRNCHCHSCRGCLGCQVHACTGDARTGEPDYHAGRRTAPESPLRRSRHLALADRVDPRVASTRRDLGRPHRFDFDSGDETDNVDDPRTEDRRGAHFHRRGEGEGGHGGNDRRTTVPREQRPSTRLVGQPDVETGGLRWWSLGSSIGRPATRDADDYSAPRDNAPSPPPVRTTSTTTGYAGHLPYASSDGPGVPQRYGGHGGVLRQPMRAGRPHEPQGNASRYYHQFDDEEDDAGWAPEVEYTTARNAFLRRANEREDANPVEWQSGNYTASHRPPLRAVRTAAPSTVEYGAYDEPSRAPRFVQWAREEAMGVGRQRRSFGRRQPSMTDDDEGFESNVGAGEYRWADGSRFVGTFDDGERVGVLELAPTAGAALRDHVVMSFASAAPLIADVLESTLGRLRQVECAYRDDLAAGPATAYFHCGGVLEAPFAAGVLHGDGRLDLCDGVAVHASWAAGHVCRVVVVIDDLPPVDYPAITPAMAADLVAAICERRGNPVEGRLRSFAARFDSTRADAVKLALTTSLGFAPAPSGPHGKRRHNLEGRQPQLRGGSVTSHERPVQPMVVTGAQQRGGFPPGHSHIVVTLSGGAVVEQTQDPRHQQRALGGVTFQGTPARSIVRRREMAGRVSFS